MEYKNQAETPREYALMQRINELETELQEWRQSSPRVSVFMDDDTAEIPPMPLAFGHPEVLKIATLTGTMDYGQFNGCIRARSGDALDKYEYSFFFNKIDAVPDPTTLMHELMKRFLRDLGSSLAKKSIFG